MSSVKKTRHPFTSKPPSIHDNWAKGGKWLSPLLLIVELAVATATASTGPARSARRFLLSRSPSWRALLSANIALSSLGGVCENRRGHRVRLSVLLGASGMGEVAGTKGQPNKEPRTASPLPLRVFIILNLGIWECLALPFPGMVWHGYRYLAGLGNWLDSKLSRQMLRETKLP